MSGESVESPLQPLDGLQPSEICDLMKGVIVICGVFLMSYVDTSMLYHIIKSQSVIKLYIFFNMLEVFAITLIFHYSSITDAPNISKFKVFYFLKNKFV